MARKYQKRKRFRRRPRKFMRRAVAKTSLPTTKYPLPQGMVTKLGYSDLITTTSTTGAVQAQQFRVNSLFDPDLTNVGHQPYVFDQLSAIYSDYVVYGCKIDMRISCTGATKVVARPTVSSTVPTNITLEQERPFSKSVIFTGSGPTKRISMYVDVAKQWGVSKKQVATDDLFAGTVSTNPTNITYLNVSVIAADQGSTVNAYIDYNLTYYCKFFKRKSISQS